MAGWIWKKSRNVFKPRLTLEHTGYSGQGFRQWCLQFANKRGGIATCGLSAMDDAPVDAAWAEARQFLCAINAEPVSAPRAESEP
jgi:hypothetical protein